MVSGNDKGQEAGPQQPSEDDLVTLVDRVKSLPYGRPSKRSVDAMLREGRGTCSTKHLYLADAIAHIRPAAKPQLVHRVYTLDQSAAAELFGPAIAQVIPPQGLTDVHRYLTIEVDGRRIAIDATFPGPPWDGHNSMPLACGPGRDYPAGSDPDAEKQQLEAQHCDPVVREGFIAALSAPSGLTPPDPVG